ncbi:MAG: hypothetical protein NTV94_11895, partial [Planctomycetota bacterium]|nr:hypothetical protein [Planctomycetota bacterium]
MNTRALFLPTRYSQGWRRICSARSRLAAATLGLIAAAAAAAVPPDNYVVLGANDLGMHRMQSDYSQMMLLPPYNNLRAQVLRRGGEPRLVTSGVTISYQIQGNTHSSDKTNFWTYEQQLLGSPIAPDVGLKGFGLAGEMRADSTHRGFIAEGVPITPIDDDGKENTYPLAMITVRNAGTILTQTQAVIPVSWEISCNLCHNTPGKTAATDLLEAHDRLHATQLISHQPVMCASCHSDNALAAPGKPGVSSLSSAMHSS